SAPKPSKLLADKALFPIRTYKTKRGTFAPVEPIMKTVYAFVPFKRRIHAIWKGIWLGECVGGGSLLLTPRRWAVAALNGVNNYAVEKDNTFVGFIQEVGINRKNHHAKYYATEFGVPNLKEDILILDPQTKLPTKVPMLDVWFEKVPNDRVRVKSASYAINNSSVVYRLFESKAWNFRVNLGDSNNYELIDKRMAKLIIEGSKIAGISAEGQHGENMITDATVITAQKLETLTYIKWNSKKLESFLSNSKTTVEVFNFTTSLNEVLLRNMDVISLVRKMYFQLSPPKYTDFLKKIRILERSSFINSDLYNKYREKIIKSSVNSCKLMYY
ncbi:MAG: hypothetical protein KDD45_17175, partial [Bdellovibrionales bacterium]|nr:hypothetical protein [Bdellovibrionales bacterium]